MYEGEDGEGSALPDPVVKIPSRLTESELTGVLGLLDKDRELQDLLCDAQERAETHREIYSKLKLEHGKLLHQAKLMESELFRLEQENIDIKQQLSEVSRLAVEECATLRAELVVFQEQGPTGEVGRRWTEQVKSKVEEEWKERWKHSVGELECLESSIYSLQQENSQLRSSYKNGVAEVDSTMKEIIFGLETQLSALKKENRSLKGAPSQLLREKEEQEKLNRELHTKLRIQSETLEDLEAQLRRSNTQISLVEANTVKSEAGLQGRILQLQAENTNINNQYRASVAEMETKDAKLSDLQQQLFTLKQENESCQRRCEDTVRGCEVRLSDMEVETAQRIAALKTENTVVVKDCEEMRETLRRCVAEAAAAATRHVQHKSTLLQDLEEKKQDCDERVRSHEARSGEMAANLKAVEAKLKRLEGENSKLAKENFELLDSVKVDRERWQNQLEDITQENNMMRRDISGILEERDGIVRDFREKEKKFNKYAKEEERRLEELRQQIAVSEDHLSVKVKKYGKLIQKLRTKLRVSEADSEKYRLEREKLKHFVSPETHQAVKKQLDNLRKKQKEFAAVIYHLQGFEKENKEKCEELANLGNSLDILERLKIESLQFLSDLEKQDSEERKLDSQREKKERKEKSSSTSK